MPETMPEAKRLNVVQFAARANVDEKQVRRAIARGTLDRGVDGLLDARQLAMRWRSPNARTREREPSHAANCELASVLLEKAYAIANLRALELGVKSGQLIPLEQARCVAFEHARAARDHWLAWPSRVGPAMAVELGVDVDRLTRVLTRFVHQHVSEMGEPDAGL